MKEAYGGILNIVFVVVFLVIVEGIFALIVSYTKAFKMKNSIISVIERYEGSGCSPELNSSTTSESACRKAILQSAERLAYSPSSLACSNSLTLAEYNGRPLYCYSVTSKTIKRKLSNGRIVTKKGKVYKVVTHVDINLPIINRITGISIFEVSGDTKIIQDPE